MHRLALVAALAALAAPVSAQQHQHPTAPATDTACPRPVVSPYAAMLAREIKALSPEQVAALHAGDGMGYALTAELNGYAGPRHVLQLADSLRLTEEQHRRIGENMDQMRAQAVRLGEEIIARERELDRAFRDKSISERQLRRMTEEIGRLTGALRAVHLAAHLAATRELSAEQLRRYQRLRGYEP